MKVVFIKELQSLIKDVRLFLFLAIVATVSIISGIISSFQYETIRSENDFLQQQYETKLRERCGQSLHHTCIWLDHLAVQKTTNDLFIAGSESINYPNYAEIDINNLYFGNPDVYYPKKSLSTDISSLKFIRFDMSFLVEVIFSFLVLLLVYNVISREKESGTLRLVLANHIPRHEILFGKIAACTLVVAVTLAFGILYNYWLSSSWEKFL